MGLEPDVIAGTGLRFFGKMSASISHEIKNCLAVINESAGLLEDFTLMAERGVAMDPARLKSLAGKVMNQIRRADGIVKNMNRFAHSVDEYTKVIDLREMIELAVNLSSRFAFMKGVTIRMNLPPVPLSVRTSPFYLQNLLGLCLEFAMENAGEGKVVDLVLESSPQGARVVIRGVEGMKRTGCALFPSEGVEALLRLLGAVCIPDPEKEELVVNLPGEVSS